MSKQYRNEARRAAIAGAARKAPVIAMSALLPMAVIAGPNYTAWTPNVAVLDTSNSLVGGCPIESRDGLSMYTASNRGDTGIDIWVNERESIDAPFGPANKLPAPVNSDANDFCPTPLGGNYLLFVSARAGGCDDGAGSPTSDIYIVRNNPATGWGAPTNLGCAATGDGPNGPGNEFSPGILETSEGTFLYYSSDRGAGQDIYMSRMRSDGSFSTGMPVFGLNTGADDRMPTLTKDGLEIVFSSNRDSWGGGQEPAGGQDVYYSSRESLDAPWSDPVNLSVTVPLTTGEASETRASFSWDRSRVNYGSGGEIYVIERFKIRGKSGK